MAFLSRLFRPSPSRFARMVIRALRQAGETGSIEYDPDELKLTVGGEGVEAMVACDEVSVVGTL